MSYLAGSEPCELKCKTCLLKPPLPRNAPLETTALTLTLQLSAASTKSYVKGIYLLLLHYLSLKPAGRKEIRLNVKSAVSSIKPSQQAEGQQNFRVPGWLSGGKLALGLRKRRNPTLSLQCGSRVVWWQRPRGRGRDADLCEDPRGKTITLKVEPSDTTENVKNPRQNPRQGGQPV